MDVEIPMVMIDLESMGLRPNCALVQVAAAAFRLDAPSAESAMKETFMDNVDLMSCLMRDMVMDLGTLNWWREKAGPARHMVYGNARPIMDVLDSFTEWLTEIGNGDPKSVDVWCKGPSMDFAVLRAAYDACSREEPWNFRRENDLRTYISRAVRKFGPIEIPVQSGLTPHYGPHDVEQQIYQLWHLERMFDGQTKPV